MVCVCVCVCVCAVSVSVSVYVFFVFLFLYVCMVAFAGGVPEVCMCIWKIACVGVGWMLVSVSQFLPCAFHT